MKPVRKIPIRYLPQSLTNRDKKTQLGQLLKSRRLYKKHKYYTRKQIPSFKSTPSQHVVRARQLYKVKHVTPNAELSRKTGCSISALRKIVNKGEGAYFSSGSRPNQTAQSWGLARLASAITGGKAAAVDFGILENGCNHSKKAFLLAKKSRRKNGSGNAKTKKRIV
jgi:hypothetical protein